MSLYVTDQVLETLNVDQRATRRREAARCPRHDIYETVVAGQVDEGAVDEGAQRLVTLDLALVTA